MHCNEILYNLFFDKAHVSKVLGYFILTLYYFNLYSFIRIVYGNAINKIEPITWTNDILYLLNIMTNIYRVFVLLRESLKISIFKQI